MTHTVRLARPADAAHLPAIERAAGEVFRSIPDLAWIADDDVMSAEQHLGFIEAGGSWVAVDGADQPIGFLSAQCLPDALHIWEISIHPSLHGKGIGGALMAAAEHHAQGLGLPALTLTTFRNVPWNEGFYRKLGFTTLAAGDLDARLAEILANEAAHGLPAEQRCAMRKTLLPQ